MREHFVLTTPGHEVRLRSIQAADCEDLRVWKNAHRHVFFHQDEITPDAQQRWYEAYLERPQDAMFVIEMEGGRRMGCVGLRVLPPSEGSAAEADVYNVMLGHVELGGRGHMGVAMRLVSSYGQGLAPRVTLRVLNNNPAWRWYEKQGFRIDVEHPDHYTMILDLDRFQPLLVVKLETLP